MEECFFGYLYKIVMFPIRLLWNIIVTGLIIGAFTLWWGFLFGSVIAVVLVLIFAPTLFFLPAPLVELYVRLIPDTYNICHEEIEPEIRHTLKLPEDDKDGIRKWNNFIRDISLLDSDLEAEIRDCYEFLSYGKGKCIIERICNKHIDKEEKLLELFKREFGDKKVLKIISFS